MKIKGFRIVSVFRVSGYCLIKSFSSLSSVEKFIALINEFHGKFHEENRYSMNHEAIGSISVFFSRERYF